MKIIVSGAEEIGFNIAKQLVDEKNLYKRAQRNGGLRFDSCLE